MDQLVSSARWVHIAGGLIALVSLWLPLFSRKGSVLHRRAGWVYVGGMLLAAAAAVVVVAGRLVEKPQAQWAMPIFLGFLAWMAVCNIFRGVRVLGEKKRKAPSSNPLDLGMAAALLLSSLGLLVYGVVGGTALLIAFGMLGAFVAFGQLRGLRRAPTEKMFWWFEHMGQMIGAAIATVTAFLVVNTANLGLSGLNPLVIWLAPSAVAVPGLFYWMRIWRRHFAKRDKAASRR